MAVQLDIPSIKEALLTKRVGLVLAGGGFKGSYQIGVWKALRELGVHKFEVIAGTSAGALNAIVIAADDLETAERIWCEKDMMRWSVSSWGTYLVAYFLLLIPFVISFTFYGIAASSILHRGWAPIHILLSCIAFMLVVYDKLNTVSRSGALYVPYIRRLRFPFFGAICFVGTFVSLGLWLERTALIRFQTYEYRFVFYLILCSAMGWFASSTLISETVGFSETGGILHVIRPFFLFVLGVAVAFAALLTFCTYDFDIAEESSGGGRFSTFIRSHGQLFYISITVIMLGVLIVGMVAGSTWGRQLTKVFRHAQKNGQLFSNAEILTYIEQQLDFTKIREGVGSLFVTIARARSYCDPFRRTLTGISWLGTVAVDPTKPGRSTSWVPEYSDVCRLTEKQKALELFRITSALPMIFKMGTTPAGEMVADGGLVDNVPIAPVLAAGVEVVLVLLLDERGMSQLEVRHHINRTWRLWVTPTLPEQEVKTIHSSWESRLGLITIDQEEYEAWKAGAALFDFRETDYAAYLPKPFKVEDKTIVIMAPRRALCVSTVGPLRFITGTLNFLLRYRRKWLRMGYDETMAFFQQSGD